MSTGANTGGAFTMHDELAAILSDRVFTRSPSLARLLTYMVEASAAGEGSTLKSYTLAVEGMGKEADFDPQANTYARVLVARLRRALDAYYTTAGAQRPNRLQIDHGSYEVRLVPNTRSDQAGLHADGARRSDQPDAKPGLLRNLVALAALVLLLVGVYALKARDEAQQARWQQNNFPVVVVKFTATGPQDGNLVSPQLRQTVLSQLEGFDSIGVAEMDIGTADYVLEVEQGTTGGADSVTLYLKNRKAARLLAVEHLPFAASASGIGQGRLELQRSLFSMFGLFGTLTSFERSNRSGTDTPYDCWLHFSGGLVAEGVSSDPVLRKCADAWYRAAPDSSMAAAVYGFSLTNQSVLELSETRRENLLDQAIKVLEQARSLDRHSLHVGLVLARAYGFAGDWQSLRAIAVSMGERTTDNPDAVAAIGTLMVMQNDMAGEKLIDDAMRFNPEPPPRYFLGKFLAAMMREDLPASKLAIDRFSVRNRGSMLGQLFTAGYEARVGNLAAAEAAWAEVTKAQPVLKVYPDLLIQRLPAAPAVKDKGREWLAPIFKD